MSQLPTLTVTVNQRQLNEVKHMFRRYPKQVNRVMSAAVNRTAAIGLTKMVRLVSNETGVLHRILKAKHIKLRKASFKEWIATIVVSGKRIPLIQFKPHPRKPTSRRRNIQGVSWKIGSSPRKRSEQAFVARMPSGHVGVFRRRGDIGSQVPRLPIVEMFGPSVPQAVSNMQELQQGVFEGELGKELGKQVDSRVKAVLDRRGRA